MTLFSQMHRLFHVPSFDDMHKNAPVVMFDIQMHLW